MPPKAPAPPKNAPPKNAPTTTHDYLMEKYKDESKYLLMSVDATVSHSTNDGEAKSYPLSINQMWTLNIFGHLSPSELKAEYTGSAKDALFKSGREHKSNFEEAHNNLKPAMSECPSC